MSAQAVSRIAALLALNGEMLREYLDPEDGEDNRADLVDEYQNLLTGPESDLIGAGDLNEIFNYLFSKLDRPTGGDEEDPGGG